MGNGIRGREKYFNGTFDFMNLGPFSDLFSKARLVSLAFILFLTSSYIFLRHLSKEYLRGKENAISYRSSLEEHLWRNAILLSPWVFPQVIK